ncbi:MAG: hypothetical protein KJO49_02290 [Bacteroidia bacterium]|nr:hypothetical protein [Bacteroidia bacterium]MBT8269387.1 hypothetical protein [Bacteroidia bacterium]NNF82277.1 hypothetical protein [Flavobacteriaceae bacterium]NNK69902.1 hypothetical protein [Flavobacteriaceae bacterium]NNL80666.1 hypothetical protein [Flavobacteriaceae bacterium]
MKNSFDIRRLLLFWLLSFGIAVPAYYLLYEIMPNGFVFGKYFRMYLYHYQNPEQYIAIPCFFYGIIATVSADRFYRASFYGRIFWTAFIIVFTILISSPFGGMLWHLHDMQAGFYPKNWLKVLLLDGTLMGLQFGWLIMALSFPYSFLGILVSHLITKLGSQSFRT